jgi:B12-binding domain/radical SAM domain protein
MESSQISLIFYYHWLNRFSFNGLAGAIDSDPGLAGFAIDLAESPQGLHKSIAASLSRHNEPVVALSILTSQLDEMRSLIKRLRLDFGSRVKIVAGGAHPTACPEEILASGADVVVRGEAEAGFPELLKRIGAGLSFEDVPGVSFVQAGKTVSVPQTRYVELDDCFSFSPGRGMFGPIEITRGCAFACCFCQTSHIFGVRLRHRSIENVVRQATALRSGNCKVVRLLSPNAFSYGSPDGRQLNLAALRQLLSALRQAVSQKGRIIFGHFPSEVRPEHVTPETLELMKEYADNDEIVIGAQSGSQRILDACNRSHTVESILTAVAAARRYGYKVIVDFIFGLPGESALDVSQTLAVIEELLRMGARIHPHAFAPLPQTRFSAEPPASISPTVLRAIQDFKTRRGVYVNREVTLRGFESS